MILETYALKNVLLSLKNHIQGHQVDADIDNQALPYAWDNEGSKSSELNVILKELFNLTIDLDIALNLVYLPFKKNLADDPSIILTKNDAMLSIEVWKKLKKYFGGLKGHTYDLMALDSNCMKSNTGELLKHFTLFQTPGSHGVNVFPQILSKCENYYVFPPFNLGIPMLKCIVENDISCTIILPITNQMSVWLPGFNENISDAFLIGNRGQKGILKIPTKSGCIPDK